MLNLETKVELLICYPLICLLLFFGLIFVQAIGNGTQDAKEYGKLNQKLITAAVLFYVLLWFM